MMIVGCHLFAIVCPVLDGLHYLKHLGGDVCVCVLGKVLLYLGW